MLPRTVRVRVFRQNFNGGLSSFIMTQKRSKKQICRRKKNCKSNKMMMALQKLRRMKPNVQREAMRRSNDAFIRSLCSCLKKLRHTRVSPKLRKRMQRHKKYLQKFLRKNTSISTKRKMLSQRGGLGFLPLIFAAAPAIGSLLGNLISRARR